MGSTTFPLFRFCTMAHGFLRHNLKGGTFLSYLSTMLAYMEPVLVQLREFTHVSVAFRIFLAAIVGGLIGHERSRAGHAAGLRTHILVSIGSTITVLVGLYACFELGFTSDPLRVSAQVISGIGFLGAGQIMTRNRTQITGLTTAAGLWTTASISLAVGLGFYWIVFVGLLVVKLTISLLPKLERILHRKGAFYYLEINDISQVNDFIKLTEKDLTDLEITSAKSGLSGHIGLIFMIERASDSEQVRLEIEQLPYVSLVIPMA